MYTKEDIIRGIQNNLGVSICEFARMVSEITDDQQRKMMQEITFEEIFQRSNITNTGECFEALVKNETSINMVSISKIEEVLKCERKVITDTLNLLDSSKGGLTDANGQRWVIVTEGERRGKKYKLQRK